MLYTIVKLEEKNVARSVQYYREIPMAFVYREAQKFLRNNCPEGHKVARVSIRGTLEYFLKPKSKPL